MSKPIMTENYYYEILYTIKTVVLWQEVVKFLKKMRYLKHLKIGIDFDKDFHSQSLKGEKYSQPVGNELSTLAKRVGYRKSKNSSGSLGRAFFEHLERIYDKNPNYYTDKYNSWVDENLEAYRKKLNSKGGSMARGGEVEGTYGGSKTESTIYTYEERGGTWYVADGSKNVNFTYDPVEEGVDIEELSDVDVFTWVKPN